jgi:hypothetical protein
LFGEIPDFSVSKFPQWLLFFNCAEIPPRINLLQSAYYICEEITIPTLRLPCMENNKGHHIEDTNIGK